MARTNDGLVRGIIEAEVDIDTSPFITTASIVITRLKIAEATDDDGELYHDAESLELLERWLSAHFYAIRDVRRSIEKVDEVSESFQYKIDLGLKQTQYGQQALLLDFSGILAEWDDDVTKGKTDADTPSNPNVSICWLGED